MTALIEGLTDRMCRDCYEVITPKGDAWEDAWESRTCLGGLNEGNAHRLHDETPENRYHSHTYDGEVSAVLEALYMFGEHSEDFGDADTFGHFALFRDCRSIMYTDSRGFVHHMTYETPAECEKAWEVTYAEWLRHEVEADCA